MSLLLGFESLVVRDPPSKPELEVPFSFREEQELKMHVPSRTERVESFRVQSLEFLRRATHQFEDQDPCQQHKRPVH